MKAIRSRKGLAEAARVGARAALAFVMTVALCIPDSGLAFASDGSNDEGGKTVDKGAAADTGTKAEGLAQLTRGASSAMDAKSGAVGDASSTSGSATSGTDTQDAVDQSNGEGYAYRVMVPSGCKLRDGDATLADDGTIALLGFADEQAAKKALSWYGNHADFAVYDGSVAKADDAATSPDATDATEAQAPVTEEENPVKAVTDAKVGDNDGKDADMEDAKDENSDGKHGLIALVDTGAKEGANVKSAETVLDGSTDDDNGHGTQMVADMVSVDPNCRIASIKALGADGNGTVSSVYAAIELAIKDGASVVNLSMSAKCVGGNPVLQKAVDDAAKAGALVVTAAGNDGADAKDYIPASLTGVAVIGACDADGKRLDKSNYGEAVAAYVEGESTSHAAAKASAWAAENLDAEGLKSGAAAIEKAVGNGFFFDGEGAHDGDGSENEAGTDEVTGENEGTQVDGADEAGQGLNGEESKGEGEWGLPSKIEVSPEALRSPILKAAASTDDSGVTSWSTWGTCRWGIDSAGTLWIEPADGSDTGVGEGADITSYGSAPWFSRRASITSVRTKGTIRLPQNSSYMFSFCTSITSIDVSHFDTSQVTNMNMMFSNCNALTSLDVSHFNTSKVTNMARMFLGCYYVPSLDVSHFDTSKVTNMSGMFSMCPKLTSLDVSHFDTSKVTNMSNMFSTCAQLTSLDVSHFDTSQVTDMSMMFNYCSKLTSLDITNFNTSKVTDMVYMFYGCSGITDLKVAYFDTSNVTNMGYMFKDCSKLPILDVTSFDTSKVTNLGSMFDGCFALTLLDTGSAFTQKNSTSKATLPLVMVEDFSTSRDSGYILDEGQHIYTVPNSTYTVKYDANGGSGSMANTTAASDASLNLPKNAFTRTGYTFSSWNTKADGSGTSYKDGQNVTNLVTSGTVTLYAQWTKGTYTISYNLGGGSMSGQKTSYTMTDAAYTLPTPTRTGYTFAGWTGSNGTTPQTSVMIPSGSTGNKTYTANWTASTHSLTVNPNGGSWNGSTSSSTISQASGTTKDIAAPTRSGYTFVGWTVSGAGSLSGTTYTFGNAAGTLTAQWKPVTYTITYNLGGGSMTGQKTSYTVTDAAFTLPTPTRTGYTFTGWTESNGTPPQTSVTVASGSTGNKTYTANWKANTYKVTYNANGGSGTMANSTATYDANFNTVKNAFTRPGYTFNGWNEKADGTGTAWGLGSNGVYENGNGAHPWKWTYAHDLTLYAQWKPNTYQVTYNGNGNTSGTTASTSVTFGQSWTAASNAFLKTGYTFKYWYDNANGTNGTYYTANAKQAAWTRLSNMPLYAIWAANSYTIAFDPNAPYGEYEGSTASEAMTYDVSKALTANGYSYAGYDFNGWNTQKDGSGTKFTDKQSVKNLATSGTVTLYAQWKPKTYSIVYNANNGAGSMSNGSITEGQSATLTGNAFTRTGYTFTSWNTKADGSGISYSDKQTVKDITGELLTNAQQNGIGWSALTANASGAPDASIKTYAKQPARDAWIDENFMPAGKTYKIAGLSVADSTAQSPATIGFWLYDKADKSNNWISGSYLDTTTSKWARTAYTYTNNDSNIEMKPWLQVSGWPKDSSNYNGSNGTGGWYRTQLSVRDMTQTSTTLYAQWKPVDYSISYNLDGGSMSGQKTSYTVTDAAYTLPTPTRTGYTFAGWTGSNGTTPQMSVTIPKGSTGDKTYTANWTINKYYLDVNGWINGTSTYGLTEDDATDSSWVGTFDVAVSGTTVSKGVNDFYQKFNYGSNYEIQNVTPKPGWVYKGVKTNSAALKGAIQDKNMTVVLVFDGVPYKVAFDGNGATSGSTAGMDMTYGVYKTLTKNGFSRTGYTFAGWNTKADGRGTSYTDAASVRDLTTTSGATVTLYAQWKPINYNVHFDGNLNTSGTMADQAMTYGTTTALTKNAYGRTYTVTLDGNGGTVSTGTLTSAYSFNGWATTASGAVVYADGAQVKNLTPTAGATVNLYANWAAKSVTLPTPTRTGYTFKGWATSADATSGTMGTYTPTGNVKLYATWEKTVYKNELRHWAGGFANDEGNNTDKNAYHFADTNFSETYGDSFTMDSTKNAAIPNGYSAIPAVGYQGLDGSWKSGTKPLAMTQEAGNYYFEYYYEPITYTIAYNMDGGTNAATNPKSYNVLYGVTFAAPTKTGYTFTGWTDAAGKAITGVNPGANATFTSASDLYTKLAARTTGNVTANAHWKANTYTVKFDANGGTGTMADEGMTFDAEKGLTANSYSRTGYSFTGWNTKPDGSGTTYQDGQSVKNFTSQDGANVTLYAQWKANEYTLTINPNGGFIGGSDKATALSPKLVFGAGNWHVISSELPKRTGYKLVGFYDAKTGGNQVYDANGLAVKGDYWTDAGSKGSYQHPADLTVYARWEAVPENMPQSGSYEMLVPVIAAACVAAAIGVRSVKRKRSEQKEGEE